MRLLNKIAFITAAGQGIGAALARGFACEGADVILNDLPGATYAEAVCADIRRMGRRSEILYGDVGRVADIQRMFADIRAQFGRLDILVNNAGIPGWCDFFENTEENFDRVVNVNLKGTLFCSIEAAKIMRENSAGGSIIHISTICSMLSVKNLMVYSATKGGINTMTEQMAVELAPYQIRVNCFAPGAINVERNLRDDPDYRENWGGVVPLGRTGDPKDLLGPALFLASEESAYVTGQVFAVDGGWTKQGKIPENSMDRQLSTARFK